MMRLHRLAALALLAGCASVGRHESAGLPADTEQGVQGDITVHSVRMHYLAWGRRDEPTVLLLSGTGGLGGVADQWQEFASRLALNYRVVAPEMRGTARSEWRGPYDWQQIVSDIDVFIDSLHLAPVRIVGLSGGAHWGVAYAALHPNKVTRLVAVEPSSNPWGPPAPRPTLPTFRSRDDALEFARQRWGIAKSVDAVLQRTVFIGTHPLPDGRIGWTIDPAGYGIWIPRGGDMLGLLAQLRVPTLLVRGAASPWPRETALRWQAAINGAEYAEVPAAGHVVPLANPDGFAEVVCAFLGGRPCVPSAG